MDEERFHSVDRILNEVREMLDITRDTGDINELTALQMLLRLTKELHAIHDPHALIAKVLDSSMAFGECDRGFMMLIDDEGMPQFKMGRDAAGNFIPREEFSPSMGAVAQVLEEERTIIVPDAQEDAELNKRESVQDLGLRTIMCSPLMIKRTIIGLLYLDSWHKPLTHYTKEHISVLASLADQSAIAIQNARKFETHS